MSSPDSCTEIASGESSLDLVCAGEYASYAEAFDHSVVVLATGHACWLVDEAGRHRVLVEPTALLHVQDQLARYDRESAGWPPASPADVTALQSIEVVTPLLWSLSVLTVFRLQLDHPEWTRLGSLDPLALFGRGEWWRAGTALFLHADAEHVITNALSGLLVFSALLTTLGRLRGWLLLGAAACIGNVAIAALNVARDYRSLGASTAIFAALGLLTGRAARVLASHRARPRWWRAMLVPLGAGLTVLALYGAGTGNVDVPAHASGFLTGAALGFVTVARRRESET